jgi:hypothetical protein
MALARWHDLLSSQLTGGFISGFVTLYLYASHGSPERVIFVLSSALLIIVPADFLRLNYPPFERSYEKVLGFLMRESEKVRHVFPPCSTHVCSEPNFI